MLAKVWPPGNVSSSIHLRSVSRSPLVAIYCVTVTASIVLSVRISLLVTVTITLSSAKELPVVATIALAMSNSRSS